MLSMSSLTDSGVKELTKLKALRILDLAGTKVSDNAVESFKSMRGLQRLDLRGTLITEDGKNAIQAAIDDVQLVK